MLSSPTPVQELRPERCTCGNTTFILTTLYYTHQGLELPPIVLDVLHWGWHQGRCPDCGCWRKAQVPAEHATGYGPRFSALIGEVAGTYGHGRRIVQTFCASVLRVPVSRGAI
jgi:transposase